jgi:recombinase
MATKSAQSKSAHWQAAFRRRMREAGLKALTVWLPKEGADRLARYPEKERGEIITRALVLLESQGGLTGESRGEDEGEVPEDTLTVAELSTRLKRVEAILSTIISNSAGEAVSEAINAQTVEPEEAVALSDTPSPPVAELTDTPTVTTLPEPSARLPPKRVAALIHQAKKLSAQGVSWKEIARRWNAEGVPTRSGIGKWHGSTVAKLSRNE